MSDTVNKGKMAVTLALVPALLGLSKDVKVTGVSLASPRIVVFDIEGTDLPTPDPKIEWITPVFEMVAVSPEDRLAVIYEVRAHWEHAPDVKWRHWYTIVSKDWTGE